MDSKKEQFLIRNAFNSDLIELITKNIHAVYGEFKKNEFKRVTLPFKEEDSFSDRSQKITKAFVETLPDNFKDAQSIILKSLGPENEHDEITGWDVFYYMPFGNYVALKGTDEKDFDLSMNLLYEITKRFTSEFPIRTFIELYPDKCFKLFDNWVNDENPHVRRLVSEGLRPRLPWAPQLKHFIKNPEPIFKYLTLLKNDPALYVRRSVANNINDIAKDNPEKIITLLKSWAKPTTNTKWIIKHGLRTLIKKGNLGALELLGYHSNANIEVKEFKLNKNHVKIGEELLFEFKIENLDNNPNNLVIDYIVNYMKANGKLAPKVFKLTNTSLKPGELISFSRKRSFKIINTRKFYPGKHSIQIQINGKVCSEKEFILIE